MYDVLYRRLPDQCGWTRGEKKPSLPGSLCRVGGPGDVIRGSREREDVVVVGHEATDAEGGN